MIPSWSEESSLAVILGTTTQRNVLIESTADDTGDLIQLPAVDLEAVIIGAKLAPRYRNSMSRGLSMDEILNVAFDLSATLSKCRIKQKVLEPVFEIVVADDLAKATTFEACSEQS